MFDIRRPRSAAGMAANAASVGAKSVRFLLVFSKPVDIGGLGGLQECGELA